MQSVHRPRCYTSLTATEVMVGVKIYSNATQVLSCERMRQSTHTLFVGQKMISLREKFPTAFGELRI